MERTIDEIKKAEQAMQELLKIAAQLRREVEIAGAKNPEQLAALVNAATKFENEAQKIKDYLQRWRQSIQ
jgi:hypothetical protein